MPAVPDLKPQDFALSWPDESSILLDVREHAEVALASIAGALHIPMGEIPDRIGELDRSRTVVVMCHSGGRSRAVAEFLKAAGFTEIYNLAGGIDAWSRDVDPTIPRY